MRESTKTNMSTRYWREPRHTNGAPYFTGDAKADRQIILSLQGLGINYMEVSSDDEANNKAFRAFKSRNIGRIKAMALSYLTGILCANGNDFVYAMQTAEERLACI
jgi:hypothetical protein